MYSSLKVVLCMISGFQRGLFLFARRGGHLAMGVWGSRWISSEPFLVFLKAKKNFSPRLGSEYAVFIQEQTDQTSLSSLAFICPVN